MHSEITRRCFFFSTFIFLHPSIIFISYFSPFLKSLYNYPFEKFYKSSFLELFLESWSAIAFLWLCSYIFISVRVCLVWREMESQLNRARESQRQQIQQADTALEQLKKQVELSSEKAYADMKLQVWIYTCNTHICCLHIHTHMCVRKGMKSTYTLNAQCKLVNAKLYPPTPVFCYVKTFLTSSQSLMFTYCTSVWCIFSVFCYVPYIAVFVQTDISNLTPFHVYFTQNRVSCLTGTNQDNTGTHTHMRTFCNCRDTAWPQMQ